MVLEGKCLMELFIIVCILVIVFAILKPQIKGAIGESVVASILSGLPKEEYRVLNNVMLRTGYGTTQIDHIVVSIYGIFVIETKNYKGWITGSEYGDYWTKNMYGKKYTFRNPLKQNYAHVKALEASTGLTEDKFIPIVAFSGNSDLKVNTRKPVVYIGNIKQVIQSYKDIKLQENELDTIVARVLSENITTKEERNEHVQQIRANIRENDAKIAAGICPRCGGQLVLRKGKYGAFTGCSNYPKCRYTKKN